MADDPMTINSATQFTIREGLKFVFLKTTGPADYDATNGAAFDVSSYVSNIYGLVPCGVDAKADALVKFDYVNDDMTDADGGAVFISESGTADAVFDNADDTTNFSGYVVYWMLWGAPA